MKASDFNTKNIIFSISIAGITVSILGYFYINSGSKIKQDILKNNKYLPVNLTTVNAQISALTEKGGEKFYGTNTINPRKT